MAEAMKKHEYDCSECGGHFTAEWPDEEAQAEFRETFGREMDPSVDAEVCDDCYRSIMHAHKGVDHKAAGERSKPSN